MKVTSKGQVTIPKAIRERAGLLPDTDVTFAIEDGTVTVRKAPGDGAGRGRGIVSRLRGSADAGLTTDQIMRLMRDGA